MRVASLLFVLFFFSILQAQPQGGAPTKILKGTIVDKETSMPLEYAAIAVYSMRDSSLVGGTITTPKGTFELEVKPGKLWMEVTYIGFEVLKQYDIIITRGQTILDLGEVRLTADSELLNEVQVVEERSNMQFQLDKRVFNVEKDLTNQGGTAADVLENIPSVEVDIDGNVSLRGSGGVRILIDGKPSGLVDGNSAEFLQFMQSDEIERVEVITNPSARYDAEGEVGIINIILKKDRKKGFNGSVTANVGHPYSAGAGFSFNYRQGKVNLFGGLNANYRTVMGYGLIEQESIFSEDSSLFYKTDRNHRRSPFGATIRLGTDINFNANNILTISGSYRDGNGRHKTEIDYTDLDAAGNELNLTQRVDQEEERRQVTNAEANYIKKFKKPQQELFIAASFSTTDDTEESEVTETSTQSGEQLQRINNQEDRIDALFQIDYAHPFRTAGKFEAGGKTTFRQIDNVYGVEDLVNGEWQDVAAFNGDFLYDEFIHAAYVMTGDEIGKFGWQAGLRTEYSDIRTQVRSTNTKNNSRYIDFFPSVHLSYKIKEESTLQLSYSRRLSRPNFRTLLPFSGLSDSRNVYRGNPGLRPEYTQSVEMGYIRQWKGGSALVSTYYRYSTNMIQRITVRDTSNLFTNFFPVNLGDRHQVGVEFNVRQKITKWWDVTVSSFLNWSRTTGEYEGENLGVETLAGNMRLRTSFKLPKDISLQTLVNYRSPKRRPQGRVQSVTSWNAGISKDIIKGKGTVSFNVRDLLNRRIRMAELDTPGLVQESEFQWQQRTFTFNFTYRINQKKTRERSGGGYDGDEG